MTNTEWHPIETAPRDGQFLLLWSDGHWVVARYYRGHWDDDERWQDRATHWMPLPEAPL
jgi:hypothetical protein